MIFNKKMFAFFILAVFIVGLGAGVVHAENQTANQTSVTLPQDAAQDNSFQWVSVVKPKCTQCAEGKNASFEITVQNVASKAFILQSIALIDSTGTVFAISDSNVVIEPSKPRSFEVAGLLPPATMGKTLYYTLCFAVSDGTASNDACEKTPRKLLMQNDTELLLTIVYALLAVLLIVFVIFMLFLLRKIDNLRFSHNYLKK